MSHSRCMRCAAWLLLCTLPLAGCGGKEADAPSGQAGQQGTPTSNTSAQAESTMPEDVYLPPGQKVNFNFPPKGYKKSRECAFISKSSMQDLQQMYVEKMQELGWSEVNTIDNSRDQQWTRDYKKDDRKCRVSITAHAQIQGLTVTIVADPIRDPNVPLESPVPNDVFELPDAVANYDFPSSGAPRYAVKCQLTTTKPYDEVQQLYADEMQRLSWRTLETNIYQSPKKWVRDFDKQRRKCRIEIEAQPNGDTVVTIVADPEPSR